MFSIKIIFLGVFSLMAFGCAIGPKYVRPATQLPKAYKESADWKKAQPQDEIIRGAWWKIFNDPRLDALEDQVNISNQNIAASPGAVCPGVCLGAGGQVKFFSDPGHYRLLIHGHIRHRIRRVARLLHKTLLNADVSWELDLWGRIRRTMEANRANAQASKADLENARLSAQAQLAQDYFQLMFIGCAKEIIG